MADLLIVSDDQRFREGITLGLGAYVIWGLVTLFWKELTDFQASELIGWRIVMSFLTLALVLWRSGRARAVVRSVLARESRALVLVAAVAVLVNWSSYILAVVHDHLIEAALGYFLSPLGTVLLGVLVMGEHLRPPQYAIIGLAGTAIAVITISYGHVPWIALLIASSWSTYSLVKRRLTVAAVESLGMEMVVLVIPALIIVAAHLGAADGVVHSAGIKEWIFVVLTGPVTVIPLWMFGAAAQRLPMTQLGPLQYVVPVINFLLGWLVYDESVAATTFVGFGLIWVALVVLGIDLARATRPRKTLISQGN